MESTQRQWRPGEMQICDLMKGKAEFLTINYKLSFLMLLYFWEPYKIFFPIFFAIKPLFWSGCAKPFENAKENVNQINFCLHYEFKETKESERAWAAAPGTLLNYSHS